MSGVAISSRRWKAVWIGICASLALHLLGLQFLDATLKQWLLDQQHEANLADSPPPLRIALFSQTYSAIPQTDRLRANVVDSRAGSIALASSAAPFVSVQHELSDKPPIPEHPPDHERPPHYFELNELTERPLLATAIAIEKSMAHQIGVPASARMRVLINEFGHVDGVQIEESDLPSELEKAAIDAFMQAIYRPGQLDGYPVRSQIRIEVSYDEETQPVDVSRSMATE